MTQALTTYEPKPVVDFDAAKLKLLRDTIARGTDDNQFALFVEVCKRTGLDPFAKQIYAVVRQVSVQRNGKWEKDPTMSIQTGIDGYRLICQRAGNYAGMDGPFWCGPDGEWVDVWLSDEPPAAAKVGVRAHGDTDWTYGVATYREYVQTVGVYDNEGGQSRKETGRKPNTMWASMPANQLAKCAEAAARRKRWSVDLANVYVDAEAGAIEHVIAVEQERTVAATPRQIEPPKRKSEKKAKKAEPGAGTAEVMAAYDAMTEADIAETPKPKPSGDPDDRSDMAFGHFWNGLSDALEQRNKTLGDVSMALNVEPSAAALKKWFKGTKGDIWDVLDAALEKVNA